MQLTKEYLDSLEQRLHDNYREIREPLLLTEVERILREHPEPTEEPRMSTKFIKRITKVASHALAPKTYEIRKASAAYDHITWRAALSYCETAIRRIETDANEVFSVDDVHHAEANHAHLYDHAANFARQFALTTSDKNTSILYLSLAYEYYTKSIKLGEINGDSSRDYAYSHRGDTAKEIANFLTGKRKAEWLVKGATDLVESAERTKIRHRKNAAFQYAWASQHMFEAAQATPNETDKIDFAEKAIIMSRKSGDLAQTFNKKHRAITWFRITEYSAFLYTLTKNKEHALSASHYYNRAAEFYQKNPDMNLSRYKNGADKALEACAKELV